MAISNVLIDPINSYPVFRPNQVLTEAQLNRMIEYLDEQNRLTRVLLLGTGVACGFEPVWVNAGADTTAGLNVSAGFGVTSDGYLIYEPAGQLNRYRLRDVPSVWFGFEDTAGLPTNFANVAELQAVAADDTDALEGTLPLTKNTLKNKVLVYLLELNNQDNQLCNNNCDGGSATRLFTLHKLLFSEDDALSILAKTYEVNKTGAAGLQDKFYHKYFMPHLAVPRFGYEADNAGQNFSVRLDNILRYDQFLAKYAAILVKYVAELSAALQQAHQIFSPVLTPGETTTTTVDLQNIATTITTGNYDHLEIQYLYDHLADLTDAYVEFVETAFDLIADCNFHPKHFPNHLMLRKFNADGNPETEPYSVFHTPYTQPPIYNENQNRLNEVRTLFTRLITLSTSYTTPSVVGADEIRITPGKSFRAPLSERAVPYYYPSSLANVWNPRRNRFNRTGQVYSYYRPTQLPYKDPLVYELEGSDFLRIEGHVGRDFMDAMSRLDAIRLKYNLAFHVIALKIDTVFNGELFQFECENFDCELQEHRDKYVEIRESFENEVINVLPPNERKLISQKFLDSMTATLDDFNYAQFSKLYDAQATKIGKKQQLDDPILPETGKEPFKLVSECFTDIIDRLDEARKRHLFYYFSSKYPGMDHKGGVPIGGTFILAYVEPTTIQSKIAQIAEANDPALAPVIQQSRIVVADFYLPYACCSNCPPICYVVARPRPIFTITPNVFCIGDTAAKELTVTAHPGGGQIIGPGYRFENGKHLFVPANAGTPDSNSQITLFYLVDGAEAKALITLVPLPVADFVMRVNNQTIDHICENEGPVNLVASGTTGQFSTIIDGVETALNGTSYDHSGIDVTPGEQVQVTIRYRASGQYCDNVIDKVLTILPLPNPAFDFAGGITEICQGSAPVQLIPEESGGDFRFTVPGVVDPIPITPDLNGNSFLKPGDLDLDPGQNVIVTVIHTIAPAAGCPNTTNKTIQVFARPTATFTIDDPNKQVCRTAPPVKLTINPPVSALATVKFTAFINGQEVNLPANANNEYFFNPALVTNPPVDGTVVRIRLSVQQGPCAAVASEQSIQVLPAPDAGFDAEILPGTPGANFIQVRVFNIKPVPKGTFTWNSVPPALQPITPPANATTFNIGYASDVQGPIRLTLTVQREGCSTVITKSPTAIQSFELWANANGDQFTLGSITPGKTFFIGEFEGFGNFNIRAITTPTVVHHVNLSLSDNKGNTILESSSKSPNAYFLDEADKPDPKLKVKTGVFAIKAIPFGQANETGKDLTVTFSINDDQAAPPAPSDETVNFLRKRDNVYRKTVSDLSANSDLAETPAFQMASAFTNFTGTVDEFNNRYNAASAALVDAAGKTPSGSPLHTQLLRLMAVTTQYFMDKQVFQESEKLSPKTAKTLQAQLTAMKKAGVKIAELKTAWKGDDLKKQLSAPAVDTILNLLK